jgi:hypothetical protein
VEAVNSDDIVRVLQTSGAETHDEWRLREFLSDIDRAGYALVRKPTQRELERGRPASRIESQHNPS